MNDGVDGYSRAKLATDPSVYMHNITRFESFHRHAYIYSTTLA